MVDVNHGVYSQRGEQRVAYNWFRDHPAPEGKQRRFLDIGAWTGMIFSNVYSLALNGWRGVCVEASPQCFVKLMGTYRTNVHVSVVCAAVCKERGLTEFHATEDALSSTSTQHRDVWANRYNVPFQSIYVCRVTIKDILHAFPGTFDFVSIDVEGGSWELLKSIDWALFGASLICVEHDGARAEIRAAAARYGFDVVYETEENIMLGKRSL